MSTKRRFSSVKNELLDKSKESMLAAVQIFNNPNIHFKSETFIVLIVISWTYLLHAYYRKNGVEYRYYQQQGKRKRFDRTKNGAYKYWELEQCLACTKCPLEKSVKNNLLFLIGLRHEIEHQMTSRIDDLLSARFQACCLNYNDTLKRLFPKISSIDSYLSFSLQFSSLNEKHIDQLNDYKDLPKNIATFISDYDNSLDDSDFNDSRYSYRVLFVPKTANRKGQADKVIEFVDPKSEIAKGVSKEYWVAKDREKTKLSATQVIERVRRAGLNDFTMFNHTQFWKKHDGKNPEKGYGAKVVKTWYWYENWVDFVIKELKK